MSAGLIRRSRVLAATAFNSRARSGAGARGLMQLMPATAGYMAKRRFRGRSRNKLYDPAFNMMLGQKYLRYLRGKASGVYQNGHPTGSFALDGVANCTYSESTRSRFARRIAAK